MSCDVQVRGGGGSGLDDESTTTGIIIIAVVCCVVGTSLVWVIIIYQTRKRHEMYSATPTGTLRTLVNLFLGEGGGGGGGGPDLSFLVVILSAMTKSHLEVLRGFVVVVMSFDLKEDCDKFPNLLPRCCCP